MLVVRYAVELFAGSGRFARSWRAHSQWPIIEMDSKWGDRYDLTRPKLQKLVRGWIMSSRVVAVWMGTPCSSFSRAREQPGGPPALRGPRHPLGLPNLVPHDAEKVRIGNCLMRFTASVLALCARNVIPCAAENPHSSRLWEAPAMLALARLPSYRTIHTDFCMFGQPWRKRTRVVSTWVDLSLASRCCSGTTVCDRTGRPHVPLRGTRDGVFLTRLAEPYPRHLCDLLAQGFQDALASLEIHGYTGARSPPIIHSG